MTELERLLWNFAMAVSEYKDLKRVEAAIKDLAAALEKTK